MTSSASSVNDALTGYVAGRVTAEQLVGVLAGAYYKDRGVGSGEWLRPVMDVIERAHPGVVELSGSADRPGFAVRLAERPFPKRYEPELRETVQALLVQGVGVGADDVGARHVVPLQDRSTVPSRPGLLTRLVRAVRRLFTSST